MSSLPFQFKFTSLSGDVRKLSFPDEPSWAILAEKVEELYGIPAEQVGLVYEDDEADQVTLSSQLELAEYYLTSAQPYRFTVRDLTVSSRDGGSHRDDHSRASNRSSMHAPHSPFNYGYPLAFEVIDRDDFPADVLLGTGIPNIFRTSRPSSQAGFVEEFITPPSPPSRRATPQAKGKGRGSHQPSVVDVTDAAELAAEAEVMSEISNDGSFKADGTSDDRKSVHMYDANHDTTVTVELDDKKKVEESPMSLVQRIIEFGRARDAAEAAAEGATDPAPAQLEDKETAPASTHPIPSLIVELANLMEQFATAMAVQPELAKSIRGILDNAATGAYWSNASGQLINESTEAQAAMRLGDAVGDFFKAVAGPAAAAGGNRLVQSESAGVPPPPDGHRGWARVRERMFPSGPPRPPPPPAGYRYPPYGGPPRYPYGGPAPPPPPPPVPSRYGGAPPMPPAVNGRFDPFDPRNFDRIRRAQYAIVPPPPPPPPPSGRPMTGYVPPPPGPPPPPAPPAPVQAPVPPQPPVVGLQPPPPPPQAPVVPTAPVPAPPVDRRTALELAKQAYIEQKELYRREKEERRREKERWTRERSGFGALPGVSERTLVPRALVDSASGESVGESTPKAGNTIVPGDESTAIVPATHKKETVVTVAPPPLKPLHVLPVDSGPPSLSQTSDAGTEMYTPLSQAPIDVEPETTYNRMLWNYRPATSSKTAPGFGLFGTSTAAATRISKRLSDIGFTQKTYPDLQARVARQLRDNADPAQDAEDTIVTRLIEELLGAQNVAPKSPGAHSMPASLNS